MGGWSSCGSGGKEYDCEFSWVWPVIAFIFLVSLFFRRLLRSANPLSRLHGNKSALGDVSFFALLAVAVVGCSSRLLLPFHFFVLSYSLLCSKKHGVSDGSKEAEGLPYINPSCAQRPWK
jgi:hypothetical protein